MFRIFLITTILSLALPATAEQKVAVLVVGEGAEKVAAELRDLITYQYGDKKLTPLDQETNARLRNAAESVGITCTDLAETCLADLGYGMEVEWVLAVRLEGAKAEATLLHIEDGTRKTASEDVGVLKGLLSQLLAAEEYLGSYKFNVTPKDATIKIAGENAEAEGRMKPGLYDVEITKEGFVTKSWKMDLKYDLNEPVDIALEMAPIQKAEPIVEELEIPTEDVFPSRDQDPMLIAGITIFGVGAASTITMGAVAGAFLNTPNDFDKSNDDRKAANKTTHYSLYSLIGTGSVLVTGTVLMGLALVE